MRKIWAPWLVVIVAAVLVAGAQVPDTTMVRGKIVFQGTLPAPQPPRLSSDPYCASRGQPTFDGMEDVIVYANPLSQMSVTTLVGDVVLDLRDCRFVPHTVTLQVGQKLILRNNDATAHNVHAWPSINRSFNVSLSRQGVETVQTFQKEEVPVPIRDDVHNWEFANVGVFLHPYHTVSRLNGAYELKLQPGTYEIVAWHERLGKQIQSFEVKSGDTRELDFLFK